MGVLKSSYPFYVENKQLIFLDMELLFDVSHGIDDGYHFNPYSSLTSLVIHVL